MRRVIIKDVGAAVAESLLFALNKAFSANVVADMTDSDRFEISTEQELSSHQFLGMVIWAEGFIVGFDRGRK